MLIFNTGGNVYETGAISGSGSLTQMGSGTLTLTGNNTYAGATTISAGTLQVGNGATAGSLPVGGAIIDKLAGKTPDKDIVVPILPVTSENVDAELPTIKKTVFGDV